jgi:hypothetical protein
MYTDLDTQTEILLQELKHFSLSWLHNLTKKILNLNTDMLPLSESDFRKNKFTVQGIISELFNVYIHLVLSNKFLSMFFPIKKCSTLKTTNIVKIKI